MAGTQLDPRLVDAFCAVPLEEWARIRREVEQMAHTEQQWGWTPPKRVFDVVREASLKQRVAVKPASPAAAMATDSGATHD